MYKVGTFFCFLSITAFAQISAHDGKGVLRDTPLTYNRDGSDKVEGVFKRSDFERKYVQTYELPNYVEYYEDDTESHKTSIEGYLIIEDDETLLKYVNRARDALLECTYFEVIYPDNHSNLKYIEQTPHFAGKDLKSDDGFKVYSNACGQWDLDNEDQRHTYYVKHLLNRVKLLEKGNCYWESVIIHEVLHTSGLVHDGDEELEEFHDILKQCNFFYEPTMYRYWYETPKDPRIRERNYKGEITSGYPRRIKNKHDRRKSLDLYGETLEGFLFTIDQ